MAKSSKGCTLPQEERPSKNTTDKFRYVVLGSDDVLMNQACCTILGETQKGKAIKLPVCEPVKAHVCGRQVQVLKTPSYWLQHLKSYMIFSSGVESMKNEMEMCQSLVFPGPHAFLLVLGDVRNTGNENYLLHALSEVFEKEALDYCMILFIHMVHPHDARTNHCVKMCSHRYHILENTYQGVEEFFQITKEMITNKVPDFFTNQIEYFQKAKDYFETEFEAERELTRESLENKERQITELEKKHAETVRELKEAYEKDLETLRLNVNHLREDLNALQLKSKRTRVSQGKKNQLQKDVKQLEAHAKIVEKCLSDAQVQAMEEQLHDCKLVEARKRELAQRDILSRSKHEHHGTAVTPPGASEHNDKEEREAKDISQASELQQDDDFKHVRRDSMNSDKPSMSEYSLSDL